MAINQYAVEGVHEIVAPVFSLVPGYCQILMGMIGWDYDLKSLYSNYNKRFSWKFSFWSNNVIELECNLLELEIEK